MNMDVQFSETNQTFDMKFGQMQSGGGVSPTATVVQTDDGAVITITDHKGTTTATVKNGKDGKDGKDGYTPIKGKDYFDGKDGIDGYTPVKGKDYFDGKDGKTPEKGVDYFTADEKSEMIAEVTDGLSPVLGDIESALDGIIATQTNYIGGDGK